MTDKEKAKAYDKALEAIKSLQEVNPSDEGIQNWINENFPELKESEDERIRKEMIEILKKEAHDFPSSVIAEKSNSWIAYLEKQGEQNLIMAKSPQLGEQKPADKIEPKFHKGEWIIHHGTENFYQIVAVIDNQYQLKYGDNYTTQYCEDVDRCARLWDITKDAKDGDVLNSMRVQATIIFKGFADDGKHILAYCALQKGIFIKQEMLWDRDFEPCPKNWNDELFSKMHESGYEWDAEKKELKKIEQKPTIIIPKFRVGDEIKTSNEESLTITKIDEKGYWSEDLFICGFDDADKWELVEQKPAWSEEDELHIKELESLVKRVWAIGEHENDKDTIHKMSDLSFFLKTLKPQFKQEWSEEDESMLYGVMETEQYMLDVVNGIKKFAVGNGDIRKACAEELNWLKSLKDRYTWKPSDEQMETLEYYMHTLVCNSYKETLFGLYQDLKKLKS